MARLIRPWLLLGLTLLELLIAIYVVAAIAPVFGSLGAVPTVTATVTTTTTTLVPTTTGVAPATGSTTPISTPSSVQTVGAIQIFGLDWKAPQVDLVDLLLVIALAAIGASVHGLTSLTTFMGNRRFRASWASWYVIRMPVGTAIAILLYFAVRAGFVTTSSSTLNPYGIAALGGLSGMFSKQATDKLRDIFETAFNTSGDAARLDKADGGVTVDHATPASVPIGSRDLTVQVYGDGFYATTSAAVASSPRSVVVQSPRQLSVTLDPSDVTQPGIVTIDLVAPGPPPSAAGSFDVRVRPQISELHANDAADRTPHVIGAGFTNRSQIFVGRDQADIEWRSADSADIAFTVTEDQFANRGALQIFMRNPAAQGGDSDPVPLSQVANWPQPEV